MNMPVYKANVGQYNVPSLNSQAEQQNANIVYKGLASFSDSVNKTAMNMYQMQKAEEAQIEGAKAAEEGIDLNNMPEAKTRGQQIFNQAAIDNYAVSFNVDTVKKLNELKNANIDNPAKFLTESDGYLRGVSQGIPAHLKGKILYPMQVHAEAAYNNLLKQQRIKQQDLLEQNMILNLGLQANQLENLDLSDDDQANQINIATQKAMFVNSAKAAVNSGVNGKIALDYIKQANNGLGISYLSNKIEKTTNLAERAKLRSDFMQGRTGIAEIDTMPISERFAISSFVSEKQNAAYKADAEAAKSEQAARKTVFDNEFVNVAKTLASRGGEVGIAEQTELKGMLENLATDKADLDKIKTLMSGGLEYTLPSVKIELNNMKNSGNFDSETLTALFDSGGMSTNDYLSEMSLLTDAYNANTSTGAYKAVINSKNNFYSKKITDMLGNAKVNKAERYFTDNFNKALRSAPLDPQQIYDIGDKLMQESLQFASEEDVVFAPVEKTRLESKGITEKKINIIAEDSLMEYDSGRGVTGYRINKQRINEYINGFNLSPIEENTLRNLINMRANEIKKSKTTGSSK